MTEGEDGELIPDGMDRFTVDYRYVRVISFAFTFCVRSFFLQSTTDRYSLAFFSKCRYDAKKLDSPIVTVRYREFMTRL